METTARYISTKDTAKLVRIALKKNFPGVKFSVRSESYAGGSSVHVRWVDGPTEKMVREVTNSFEGAEFDGMQDLKSYKSTFFGEGTNLEKVHFGADYVISHRETSEAAKAAFGEWFLIHSGEEFNGNKAYPFKVTEDGLALSHCDWDKEFGYTLFHQKIARTEYKA